GGEVGVGGAEVRGGAGHGVVAGAGGRWPGVEVLRVRELLAEQRAADDLPVHLDERAVGLVVEGDLGHTGHDERVGQAADHREDDDPEDRRPELTGEGTHHFTPRALMTTSMSLMPMKGTMIPPMP